VTRRPGGPAARLAAGVAIGAAFVIAAAEGDVRAAGDEPAPAPASEVRAAGDEPVVAPASVAPAAAAPPATTPAATTPPAAAARPSDGGPFITPRLLVQGDAVVLHHGPSAPALEDGTTRPGFYLRRARAGLDAADGDWRARAIVEVTARTEVADAALDPIAGEMARGRTRATEAYVAYAPGKAFTVALGSLRVPLGLSRQIDEGGLRLPERARVITRMAPDFRMGVAAWGDLGLLQYAVGGFSPAPVFGSDFRSSGSLTVVRLATEPLGPVGVAPDLRRSGDPWYGWWRVSAGVTGFYGALPGSNELGVGGDAQFQWARVCATGELLWSRRDGADRLGFTLEPGVFVIRDRLELVARAEWFDDQLGAPSPSPADGWGAALGATFFSAGARARLQAAATWRRGSADGDRAATWAVIRATFTL